MPTRNHIHVLLIEDDRELAKGVARSLEQSGYVVEVAHTGQDGVSACERAGFQLVILDLGLPDMDGMDVLKRLRKIITVPILIVTARHDVENRILGLDAGGDDYLTKPAELDELEARIRALLRRGAPIGATVEFADLAYEPASQQATVNGIELELTAKEVAVLELLLRRQGKVVSKSQFVHLIYNPGEDGNPSMIEVFVSRLRRKLGAAKSRIHIRSLRGLGYRMEEA